MTEVIGYKGFDLVGEGLFCRNMKFEVGKTYVTDGAILCSKGFHFCDNLKDVFAYYPVSSATAYYKIKASGTIVTGKDKSCSTEIQLLEKIGDKEIMPHFLEPFLSQFRRLSEKENGLILGGSIALMLHNVIDIRHPHDLDVNLPYFSDFGSGEQFEKKSGVFQESGLIGMEVDGIAFDLFFDQKNTYTRIEFGAHTYKVCDVNSIMNAKWKYVMSTTNPKKVAKHKKDIIQYLTKKSVNKLNDHFDLLW